MTLVSSKEMMINAYQNHYAVPAFATHNLEIMKAVVEAAEELSSPIIFQTTPGTIKYVGVEYMAAMARVAAEKSTIPIALHLDHGDCFETVIKCLRAGYTSIMFDGSRLSFSENIALVQKVVEVCHPVDVPVEAELGTIGGVEEDLEIVEAEARYTSPQQAETFVKQTKIDSFAPAFGTAHGVYKDDPKLDFNRLQEISTRVCLPIVMHGASGVSSTSVREALKFGVSKVNISTDLKNTFIEELRQYLKQHPKESDPRKYFLTARQVVKDVAKQIILNVKSDQKA
ncbi:MAG TPA: class II fructose-bisphosphate aldolase [Bacillales bacterium]|nr:class II fructose-bisphosphate aldolase [Bacillales bacterium]